MWHLCHRCHICHIVFIEAQVAPKAGSRNTRGQGKSNIPEGGFPHVERLFGVMRHPQTRTNVRRYQSASRAPQNAPTTAPAASEGPKGIAALRPRPTSRATIAPAPPKRIDAPPATPT